MAVRTVYYRDPEGVPDDADSFMKDLRAAVEQARLASDPKAAQRIRDLALDSLYVRLPAMSPAAAIDYLETRRVWRWSQDYPVYKTADLPCAAFTADVSEDESEVTITALATCYRYPANSEDRWWTDIVEPRVRTLWT